MTRTIKHLSPVVGLLLLVAAVVTGVFAVQFSGEREYEIVVVLKSTNPEMEFWEIVGAGIETAAREYDMSPEIVGPWLEKDIDDQIRIFNDVIEQRPDGVILAASDYEALSPLADEARDRGIELVTIDSGLRSDAASSFIATDNLRAGRKAGQRIGELVGESGNIALISHIREVATAIDREEGVREGFEAVSPEGTILGTYYTDNEIEIAYGHAMYLLENEPDLSGLVATNELTTIGVARAIVDAGMSDSVHFVGFDHSKEEIMLLEQSVIDALVVQKPFNMGYLGITTLRSALAGETVPEFVDTGSVIVDRDNLYTAENQRLLFPFTDRQ